MSDSSALQAPDMDSGSASVALSDRGIEAQLPVLVDEAPFESVVGSSLVRRLTDEPALGP